MSEWWTYRLSNFLMFAPRTYYRLIERYNLEVWPLHLATMAAGAVILLLIVRRRNSGRVIATLLAIVWLWIAWAFHLERYRTIFYPAGWLAALFAAQAVLMIWIGVVRNRFTPRWSVPAVALFVFAWLIQPLIGLFLGRPWTQLEVFGIAPDPTVAATFAVVLAIEGRAKRIALLIVPLLWAAFSGLTLWAMGAAEAFVLPAVALFGVTLAGRAGWNRAQ
jgi:Family of unknown function (DUF6064)